MDAWRGLTLNVEIHISEELRNYGVKLGVMTVSNVVVRQSSPQLIQAINNIVEESRRMLENMEKLRLHPHVKAYRSFLWRLGIDPTKTRPSSEALARRILRGASFPIINNVVDSGNAASLYYMVPIGLYDLDNVKPPLRLEICGKECLFEPIGGEARRLKEGTPVLLDSTGYILHVYPHRDARRTSITSGTRRVLAISAGVKGVGDESLIESLKEFTRLLLIDQKDIEFTPVKLV